MKRLITLLAIAVLALAGCKGVEGGVSSIGPGKHTVTSTMRGYWKAESAEAGCAWGVFAKGERKPVLSGTYRQGSETQAVILGTGTVGMVFMSNTECGKWTK